MPRDNPPDPTAGAPLPAELEAACATAARAQLDMEPGLEHVLLVGADRALLARVAQRIHELTTGQVPGYAERSCRGMPASYLQDGTQRDGTPRPSWLEIYLRSFATVHLADVESASDEVAWGIHELVSRAACRPRARVIASTAVGPEQWPPGPLRDTVLDALRLRFWRRIEVGDPAAGRQELAASEAENVFRRTATRWCSSRIQVKTSSWLRHSESGPKVATCRN